MCCIFALLMVFGPRVALFFTWIFTDQVTQAFSSFWLPFAGLIFLPWTTLMWAFAYAPIVGVTGFWGWAFVALGVLLDVSAYSSSAYKRGWRAGSTGGGGTATYA